MSSQVRALYGVTEHKFISAGREDIDVRMLGEGRPFVLELLNPRHLRHPQSALDAIQAEINATHGDLVECRALRQATVHTSECLDLALILTLTQHNLS